MILPTRRGRYRHSVSYNAPTPPDDWPRPFSSTQHRRLRASLIDVAQASRRVGRTHCVNFRTTPSRAQTTTRLEPRVIATHRFSASWSGDMEDDRHFRLQTLQQQCAAHGALGLGRPINRFCSRTRGLLRHTPTPQGHGPDDRSRRKIGIGGRLATPPLPHHRAYGSRTTAVRPS